MKIFSSLVGFCASAAAISVSFDSGYDERERGLDTVSCSDGSHGLLTRGYTTQSSLPSFPRIGGTSFINGWNSASCGSCWTLSYNGSSIDVLAMDRATDGFNIARAAMEKLAGSAGVAMGRIEATYAETNASACGI
ncbi:unnamed protein product [Blumeria hordei]|uniref:Uncharacterized protein n=2 Tax=Blumeria hordei TaxID=2867405 RepID=A0A383URR3_BLUHO|nr:putative effector protein [Blumeria hordei DH14]SZF03001.1 unnamed protein product [Blumeria hordei]